MGYGFQRQGHLFLVGYLPSADGHTIQKGFDFRKGERIVFKHGCIPIEFGQGSLKTEGHALDGLDRYRTWHGCPVPVNSECRLFTFSVSPPTRETSVKRW